MGTLCFICPVSESEVDTGIELDMGSFDSLRAEPLGCPECLGVHRIGAIKAWVREAPRPVSDTSLLGDAA